MRERDVNGDALRWWDRAARVGFLAKAVVYAIVGGYALQVALGDGGAFLDKEGVAKKIEIQAHGALLLAALGAGLLCYAAWRFVQAIVDPRGEEHGTKGLAKRLGWAASGVVHALLALTVFQTLTGADDDRESWLAAALAQPGGRWIVVACGAVAMGVGGYQIWRAYRASFVKKLERSEMSPSERRWAVRTGRLGLLARGIVFPIIGWYFVQAGLRMDASQAQGTGAALRDVAGAPLGSVLLPVVAFGLIAYAALMVVNARYRRPFA